MTNYPLSASQSEIFLEWDCNHAMTQYNMAGYLTFNEDRIDRSRLEKALKKLLSLRPYLHNRLIRVQKNEVKPPKYFKDPTLLIRQYPDMNQKIELEFLEMTDEEADEYVQTPTKPFDLFNEPMIRFQLIQTPSRSIIAIVFFHLLVDGVTIKKVHEDLSALYSGREIAPQGLEFYELATKEYEAFDSERYLIDKQWFEERFKDFSGFTDFAMPFQGELPWGNSIFIERNIQWKIVDDWAINHGCSSANLLMAIYAKALSITTGERKVTFYTVNHGRSIQDLKDPICGHLFRPMILMINVNPEDDILALAAKAKSEMFANLRHRTFPVFHYFLNQEEEFNDYGTEFLYDGPYMEFSTYYDTQKAYWHWFDFGLSLDHVVFTIYERGINYAMEIDCSDKLYKKEEINCLMDLYLKILTSTIESA